MPRVLEEKKILTVDFFMPFQETEKQKLGPAVRNSHPSWVPSLKPERLYAAPLEINGRSTQIPSFVEKRNRNDRGHLWCLSSDYSIASR